MWLWRHDPGPCPICGAPHTACTRTSGAVVVAQLPARDGLTGTVTPPILPAPLRAEQIQATLPPNEFTTGTYRGKRRRP